MNVFTIVCSAIIGLCLLITFVSSLIGIVKSIQLKIKAKKDLKEKENELTNSTEDSEN